MISPSPAFTSREYGPIVRIRSSMSSVLSRFRLSGTDTEGHPGGADRREFHRLERIPDRCLWTCSTRSGASAAAPSRRPASGSAVHRRPRRCVSHCSRGPPIEQVEPTLGPRTEFRTVPASSPPSVRIWSVNASFPEIRCSLLTRSFRKDRVRKAPLPMPFPFVRRTPCRRW